MSLAGRAFARVRPRLPMVLRDPPELFLAKNSALRTTGWLRSRREHASVDDAGEPIPWITYAAMRFLEPRVGKDLRVFELDPAIPPYGGRSALIASWRSSTTLNGTNEWPTACRSTQTCGSPWEMIISAARSAKLTTSSSTTASGGPTAPSTASNRFDRAAYMCGTIRTSGPTKMVIATLSRPASSGSISGECAR